MLRLVLALLAPLALLLTGCATTYTGPFAHEVSPDLYTVAFENDEVRVLVANYAPGDESNTFMTPPSLLIFVSDASRWKETYPDGSSFEFPDPTPGGLIICYPGGVAKHRNVSDNDAHLIIVNFLQESPEFCPPPPG